MRGILEGIGAYIRRTDRWLWFLVGAATCFGLLSLVSMRYSMGWSWSKVGMVTQAGAAGMGFVGAVILSHIDYVVMQRWWKIYTIIGYGMFVLIYLLRNTQFVLMVMDNYNWFVIPLGGGRTLSIQPSEFLKLAFILDFSIHIEKVRDTINRPLTLFVLLLHASIPVMLIHTLGDDGTAIVFLLIAITMLMCCGLSWVYIGMGIAVVVIGFPLAWKLGFVKDYQMMRITALYNPEELDPATLKDALYQLNQGLLSMGIGGASGGGIVLEKPYNVVYMLNDFMFTYVGQYAGFIGCLAVIVILGSLCLRCLLDARRSVRLGGRAIAAGVFGMLAAQICINLGMCLGVLPVIGVPLPFFSQGGTSMLVNWLAIGLVQSVYMHNDSTLFHTRDKHLYKRRF